jgi:hypothetical protein
MPRRRVYNQMVDAHDSDDDAPSGHPTIEAAPVAQRAPQRWPLLVALVVVFAVVAIVYVNNRALAKPEVYYITITGEDAVRIMDYTETDDPYFVADDTPGGGHIDEVVARQRLVKFTSTRMGCTNVEMLPLGNVAGMWRARCVQE